MRMQKQENKRTVGMYLVGIKWIIRQADQGQFVTN